MSSDTVPMFSSPNATSLAAIGIIALAGAISYGVHEDLEVDGKPVKLDAFDTSVWKQTENGWACVLHTESIKGDAYGRDRTPGWSPN